MTLVAAEVQVRSLAWCSGLKYMALLSAVARSQSLAWEILYATGVAIKKKTVNHQEQGKDIPSLHCFSTSYLKSQLMQ